MNANGRESRYSTNVIHSRLFASIRGSRIQMKHETLIHKQEVHAKVGCAKEVLNGLGYGLLEEVWSTEFNQHDARQCNSEGNV